ncbi:Putative membrane protein [Paraburkholderia unamae]|uniref:AzlD family protein n=1 Tax=Paraburkholderia unamae TaxID=219649 RepID=UPI000DC5C5B1|nr:AzlD family protein [Paraburkholderia unamae]RAR59282.1 putative membrane protein [Paraburkholderia unamae]CAG9247790.1 Putative membrane protein [Paraburkholderia unamae]
MLDWTTVVTIVLMAASTYMTRIVGFVVLRDRTLSPRTQAIMESVPGCVLVSVIAPAFVSSHPADLLGLAVTFLAATRLSLLPTVVVGVVATGVLRHLIV